MIRKGTEMKIAVIGAGAMGSIYGGHLSLQNEVYMVDTNEQVVRFVNENGITLEEGGEDHIYRPKAVTDTAGLPEMDLVILFVKALFSRNHSAVSPLTSSLLSFSVLVAGVKGSSL